MGCRNWGMSPPSWMILALVGFGAIGRALTALTPLVHMTKHCFKTVYVNDSLVLDLTENLQADRVMVGHLSCAVTLHAPPAARVYLHVLQLAISDHAQMPDRLHIYDVTSSGEISQRLTPSTGLYGVLERPYLIYNTAGMIVPDFRSTGSRMRLDYQGKPTVIYRGFRVLVTAFYDPDSKGRCRPGTVHCAYARTCVPFSTRCDDFSNCGLDDNSDEKSCQREYVVSDVLEEYSTRTAVIAAVSGILVFLGVSALVLVILIKYTRKKYSRGADQSARYTSGGRGGASRDKDKDTRGRDLARLYAPPSYEDVMSPQDQELSLLGRCGPRHCGPPPAYSAVAAALVHQEEAAAVSSEEEAGHKRPATLWSPPPTTAHQHPPSLRQQQQQQQQPGLARAEVWEEEDVRMHGTWPSDTDEEEEVKSRRRRKGGKGKGKGKLTSQRLPKAAATPRAEDGAGVAPGEDAGSSRWPGGAVPGTVGVADGTPTSSSPSPDCSSRCSPSHPACLSADGSQGARQVPGGAGSGAEAVSETESQQVGSKRNSRTESHSPDSSSGCSHPESPEDLPQGSPPDGGCLKVPDSVGGLRDLPADPPSSVHPLSPSVSPAGKLSPVASSEDELLRKEQSLLRNGVHEEDFVDLNPSKGFKQGGFVQA